MKKLLYQQGDVLIYAAQEVRGKKRSDLTLAKGEHTGHHHTITRGEAELYEDENGVLWLAVAEEAVLAHQEHGELTLPQGIYEIGGVREYDHFAEEARRVQD